jgi:hypothetical protein
VYGNAEFTKTPRDRVISLDRNSHFQVSAVERTSNVGKSEEAVSVVARILGCRPSTLVAICVRDWRTVACLTHRDRES